MCVCACVCVCACIGLQVVLGFWLPNECSFCTWTPWGYTERKAHTIRKLNAHTHQSKLDTDGNSESPLNSDLETEVHN